MKHLTQQVREKVQINSLMKTQVSVGTNISSGHSILHMKYLWKPKKKILAIACVKVIQTSSGCFISGIHFDGHALRLCILWPDDIRLPVFCFLCFLQDCRNWFLVSNSLNREGFPLQTEKKSETNRQNIKLQTENTSLSQADWRAKKYYGELNPKSGDYKYLSCRQLMVMTKYK